MWRLTRPPHAGLTLVPLRQHEPGCALADHLIAWAPSFREVLAFLLSVVSSILAFPVTHVEQSCRCVGGLGVPRMCSYPAPPQQRSPAGSEPFALCHQYPCPSPLPKAGLVAWERMMVPGPDARVTPGRPGSLPAHGGPGVWHAHCQRLAPLSQPVPRHVCSLLWTGPLRQARFQAPLIITANLCIRGSPCPRFEAEETEV